MADFSKQWCEQNDFGMPGDFDILKEADALQSNSYVSMICEGYGFNAIGKDIENNIMLAFHNWQDGTTKWVPYNQIVK
jgi:hypothetical protein